MEGYDIKIVRSGKIRLQISERHDSDLAATRAARKLCGADEIVEIWRGNVCVYSGRLSPAYLVWPITPGKGGGLACR